MKENIASLRTSRLFSLAVGTVGLASFARTFISPAIAASLRISSPAFAGPVVPLEYTCSGADQSPSIAWSGVPEEAKSLAVVLDDPDAPSGDFTHWLVYNLRPDSRGLPDKLAKTTEIADGGEQGRNDFGRIGYNGPCPPPGPPHHYRLTIYALSKMLSLNGRPSGAALARAMKGHVLDSAQVESAFGR